jgi:hypothetical protein
MGRLIDSMRAAMRSRGATETLQQMDAMDAAGGTAAAEKYMEQMVGGAEIDPNDPDFAPVDGVGVDDYARICRAIVDAGPGLDEAAMHAVVKAQGVEPAKWAHIGEVWNERVMRSNPVKLRYSAKFIS